MLTPQHIESLAARAIPEAVARACGIESFTEGSIKASLGVEHSLGGDGFSIPYIYNGEECMGDDGVPYARFRIQDERTEKDLPANFKKQKYLQRAGAGFMPFVPANFVRKAYLVITEGELKAISACNADIPTIAIAGVDMWYDADARTEGDKLTTDSKVHPVILDMVKNLAAVVVLADSDARSNAHVRQAMSKFCEALRNQSGIAVIYKSVPSMSKDEKLGLDDWIAKDADDARGFIARAVSEAVEVKVILDQGGYVPLGYQDLDCVIWSRTRKAIIRMTSSHLSSPNNLQSVAGTEWCKVKYGVPMKDSEKIRVEWDAMSSDIIDSCTEKGFFSDLNTRGAGVWKDRDGRIVVNAKNLWCADGGAIDRVSGDFVYQEGLSLGFNAEAQAASVLQIRELLDCLNTWHWKHKSDAVLMLGWIAHGYLCGALDWRTHANLTGGRGTGKSTLMRLISILFGPYALLADGDSSEAGIRQKVGNASRPIMIDEGEADGTKLAKILQMLRAASSGSGVLRGTQDQAGTEYVLRACGMVGGIVPPQLNGADASRFLRLELDKQQSVKDMHALIKDDAKAKALGQAIWMRMIVNFDRFNRTLDICKTAISMKMDSSRAADTIGNVIAASWIALSDGEMTLEAAIKYLDRFELTEAKEQQKTDDSVECFNHILGSVVRFGNGQSSIVKLMEAAIDKKKGMFEYDCLGNYGLKVSVEDGKAFLKINTTSAYFMKLFDGTRWQSGAIRTTLMRVEGAKSSYKTVKLASIPCKPVIIPVDINIEAHIETLVDSVM